jgi:hypothetical protein
VDSSLPTRARIFIGVTAAIGVSVLGFSLFHWHSNNLLKFACYLTIAVLASTLKVRLPGMESTMSVHFLFVLLGVLELSLAETLTIGCAAALLQSMWKTCEGPEPVKVHFNVVSMTAPAIFLTYCAFHMSVGPLRGSVPLLLLVAAFTYFVTNTVPVAIIIALAEARSLRQIWSETFFWSLPYYLVGAAIVGLVHYADQFVGWENALLIVPVMYWIYRSYLLYLGRLEDEKKRVEIEAGRWRRRSGTSRKCAPCICAPSRGSHWPSTQRTTPRISICTACASLPSSWPRRWDSTKRRSTPCAQPRSCTTSASSPSPTTSSISPAA